MPKWLRLRIIGRRPRVGLRIRSPEGLAGQRGLLKFQEFHRDQEAEQRTGILHAVCLALTV
jgi:hypothetical protein